MKYIDEETGLLSREMRPGEDIQFHFDLSAHNLTIDTVESVQSTAKGAVAEVDALSISLVELGINDKIYFWAAGGTDNEDYQVIARFTTTSGEQLAESVIIKCRLHGF
ncbi:MAG: hypothetical protein M0R47_16915 [Methylobacter sp.]|uniref:phage fiber-tail adaptor protein n=1 Tax=Methylobacter sp. TaxID=2051955 RepID=UPI0025D5C269|nr:hypothetical protein [Methylobacter sp.]MCK9622205.1 hypothetical protein [Methylobacter sp.]